MKDKNFFGFGDIQKKPTLKKRIIKTFLTYFNITIKIFGAVKIYEIITIL